MFLTAASIRYQGFVPRPGAETQRQWNDCKREAAVVMGDQWHAEMRTRHFTREAYDKYGYGPRAGETGNARKNFWRSYTGRKQKEKHHTLPLVFSGELRELSRVKNVTATATAERTRCSVAMPMANKANFKNPASSIDMRDELTRVADDEAETLSRTFADELQTNLRSVDEVMIAHFHSE